MPEDSQVPHQIRAVTMANLESWTFLGIQTFVLRTLDVCLTIQATGPYLMEPNIQSHISHPSNFTKPISLYPFTPP